MLTNYAFDLCSRRHVATGSATPASWLGFMREKLARMTTAVSEKVRGNNLFSLLLAVHLNVK